MALARLLARAAPIGLRFLGLSQENVSIIDLLLQRLKMMCRKTIFAFSAKLAQILRTHIKISIVIRVITALSPYLLLATGHEFISDIVSFILYTYLVFSVRIPTWILARVFRIQKVNEAKFDWNSRKWSAWWFSGVVMGSLSFGYWILKKYQFGVVSAELFSLDNMIPWMLLVAVSGYYAIGLTQRDYLINVFHFDDADFKRNKLDFQAYLLPGHVRTVKEMIITRAGKAAYNTCDKASFVLGLSVGFFAVLPGIMFHGGAIFIDIVLFALMAYSLIFNPERISSYEERFYMRLIGDLRNPISASKIFTFIPLCSLAGLQMLKWNGDLAVFLVNLLLIFFALVSMTRLFPTRISGIAPFSGALLICAMCTANSISLPQTIGYSLIPILTFLLIKTMHSLLDLQARKGSIPRTLAYSILSAIVFVPCAFLVTMGSMAAFLLLVGAGLFLGFVILVGFLGGEFDSQN